MRLILMIYGVTLKGMRLRCKSVVRAVDVEIGIWRLTMGIGGRSTPFSHDGAGRFGFGTFQAGKETPKCPLGDKK